MVQLVSTHNLQLYDTVGNILLQNPPINYPVQIEYHFHLNIVIIFNNNKKKLQNIRNHTVTNEISCLHIDSAKKQLDSFYKN